MRDSEQGDRIEPVQGYLRSQARAARQGNEHREHVVASLQASPWARVIKLSDFTDNAIGLFHTTGPKLPKLAAKYRPLVPVLRELVLRPDTPLEPGVKHMIAGKLDNAEDRFSVICAEHAEGSQG